MSDDFKAYQHTVTTAFVTGATTCASEPGKFCRFAMARGFGTRPFCALFNERLDDTDRRGAGRDGWLQRTESCMKACPATLVAEWAASEGES